MKKPKNYYCHRILTDAADRDGVPKKFEIVEKIGQGSFGEVYKVFDPSSSHLMVIKKFKKQNELSEEGRILQQLTNSSGFQQLKTYTKMPDKISEQENNKENSQSTIMMGCLGPSTAKIMHKVKKMNVYSMKRIAYQLILRLKELHTLSYIHRDIKPDNILFGNKYDSHSVYLVDFGLTTSYKKNSTKARKVFNSIVGTARYCPLASHLGMEQFPKDDLQSLGYVLLYLLKGQVPWDDEDAETDEQLFLNIYKRKKEKSIEQLCLGLNCLRKYWTKVKELIVGQKINYQQLASYFDVGDPNQNNCYEFCENCWTRGHYRNKSKIDENEITVEPKSNPIRNSILS